MTEAGPTGRIAHIGMAVKGGFYLLNSSQAPHHSETVAGTSKSHGHAHTRTRTGGHSLLTDTDTQTLPMRVEGFGGVLEEEHMGGKQTEVPKDT
jgi:hypothetical protein